MPHKDPLARLESGPVFITGWVRSGTTWLYDVLTAHPRVGGVLESWMFTHQYGVPGPLADFHWEPDPAGTTQGLARIADREEVYAGVRALTSEWLSRGLDPEDRHLVEKSPSHLFTMPLIAQLFPEARFLHIVRDGRDVAVSVRAASNAWASGWKEGFASSLQSSAESWNRAVLRGLENAETLGDRCLQLRYEDLREQPHALYESIFEHCRIPVGADELSRIEAATVFRPDPGGESAHRRRGRPGEWRRELSAEEIEQVETVAGPALEAAGYIDPVPGGAPR